MKTSMKTIILAILTTFLPLANFAVSETNNESLRDKLHKEAEAALMKHNVPGVAFSVIREGKVLWAQGVGFADKASKTRVNENTIFNVGSVSKTVSAFGFMRLVEDGVVDLDAPIQNYLTRWKLPASDFDSEGVTLRRILSHSAGLTLSGYPGFQDGTNLPSLEESLSGRNNGAGKVTIGMEPGMLYRYSGGGYTIAQLMLEEQTKTDFSIYMKKNVLLPLGMTSSNFGWTNASSAATPYDEEGNAIIPVRFTELAAGLETTCRDLALFAAISLNTSHDTSVLKRDSIKLMQEKESPGDTPRSAGLGYQQMKFGPIRVVGHLGANQGWQTALLLKPETGDGLVVLTNGSNGDKVAQQIFRVWARDLMTRSAR